MYNAFFFTLSSLKPLHLHTINERPNGQSILNVNEMARLINDLKLRLQSLGDEITRLQRQVTPPTATNYLPPSPNNKEVKPRYNRDHRDKKSR